MNQLLTLVTALHYRFLQITSDDLLTSAWQRLQANPWPLYLLAVTTVLTIVVVAAHLYHKRHLRHRKRDEVQ